MMGTFSVKVFSDTLTKSISDNITGKIHVEANGFLFPEYEWDDFVVIILGWWLEALTGLISGKEKCCSCLFMDGPLQFNIELKDPDMWIIQFIKRGLEPDKCLWEGTFTSQEISKGMLFAADAVIKVCREKGWYSTDVKTLIDGYSALNSLMKKY